VEQTIAFYVQDTLHLNPGATARTVGGLLAIFGVVSAAVQGGAIRPLSRRFPPPVMILMGLGVMAGGMLLDPLGHTFWAIAAALGVIGLGSALIGPSVSAALSLGAGNGLQGMVAGLNSTALALGRMAGPLLATGLYQTVSHASPYLLSAGVLLAVLVRMFLARPRLATRSLSSR
jgi:MFS family permease